MIKKRYDIIIYLSLVTALVFLGIAAYDYLKDETKIQPKEKIIDIESEELKALDKKSLLIEYFETIKNTNSGELFTKEMVDTWTQYDITSIEYQKKITEDYYSYDVNLLINGENVILPESIQTHEENGINVQFNVNFAKKNDAYVIKNIEIK